MEGDRLLGVLSDFVSGELEEEVGGLPFVEACFFVVYLLIRIEIFKEGFWGVCVLIEGALALVA